MTAIGILAALRRLNPFGGGSEPLEPPDSILGREFEEAETELSEFNSPMTLG